MGVSVGQAAGEALNLMHMVSVIIPTHNRSQRLRQTIVGLKRQTVSAESFEVIVVADGCIDDTVSMLKQLETSFSLRIVELPGSGPSAARNAGAQTAKGSILAFLDDDIDVIAEWLAAHLQAHHNLRQGVVLGYLPLATDVREPLFRGMLRIWWERMYDGLFEPGHRFTYENLLTGNFSISAELFHNIGGFDETLRCHEDYEFGLRLINQNVDFAFAPNAVGYHDDHTDLQRATRRKFDEGVVDVELGQRHPELRSTQVMYNLNHFMRLPSRILRHFAFRQPHIGDMLAQVVMFILRPVGWLNLRLFWLRLVYGVLTYWYWRGVAQRLPDIAAVQRYLAESVPFDDPAADLVIDIAHGLERAEQRLDVERPRSVAVWQGAVLIGRIPNRSGAERLRGRHLRPALRDELAIAYANALQKSMIVGQPSTHVDPSS